MSTTKLTQLEELDLDEFDNVWDKWRTVARNVSEATEGEIRMLLTQFGLLQSQIEYNLGVLETQRNTKQFQLEIKRAELLSTTYNKETVKRNEVDCDNDPVVKILAENLHEAENNLIIGKASRNAIFSAWQTCSRELSARLGK